MGILTLFILRQRRPKSSSSSSIQTTGAQPAATDNAVQAPHEFDSTGPACLTRDVRQTQTMKKCIVYIIDAISLMLAMTLGLFGPVGLCAAIWGGSILDTALGDPPMRTHPAFLVFIILIAPSMLLSAFGAIIAIIIPLHIKTCIPLGDRDHFFPRTLKYLADKTECLEKNGA